MPMENVVSALSTGLSADAMWGQVGEVAPFIIITTLFGLGFYLVKRLIRRTRTTKGGI